MLGRIIQISDIDFMYNRDLLSIIEAKIIVNNNSSVVKSRNIKKEVFDIKFIGKICEYVYRNIQIGSLVYIQGSVKTSSSTDLDIYVWVNSIVKL